jgi:hypothetical protein
MFQTLDLVAWLPWVRPCNKIVGIDDAGGIVGIALGPGWRNWQTRQT